MPIFFSAILGWFSSLAGRFLVDTGLRFLAQKALLYMLLVAIFPVVIKNLVCWLVDQVAAVVASVTSSSGVDSLAVQLTGLGGWLGDALLLPTCISILLSAICIRFVLNFVPFIR